MAGRRKACATIFLLISFCRAQNALSWVHGEPNYLSYSDPLVAHLDVFTDARSTIVAALQDERRILTSKRVELKSGAARVSILFEYFKPLSVGRNYTLLVNLHTRNTSAIVSKEAQLLAVEETLQFYPTVLPPMAGSDFYEMELEYSAPETRMLVLAVRDGKDMRTLGSGRTMIDRGSKKRVLLKVPFRPGAEPIKVSQAVIVRADIRLLDGAAKNRLTRTEYSLNAASPHIFEGTYQRAPQETVEYISRLSEAGEEDERNDNADGVAPSFINARQEKAGTCNILRLFLQGHNASASLGLITNRRVHQRKHWTPAT